MKNIYIVRHGETDFNKSSKMQGRGIDASINAKGKEQAEAVACFLKGKSISQIITSSMKRAIESATPLSLQTNITLESYADLDEMSFGRLEGKPINEVEEDLNDIQKHWNSGDLEFRCPDGENPIEVFNRANEKAIKLIENSSSVNIVFVLHGRLIRVLLSEWLGLGLKNMNQIEHQNGAVNHLTWQKGMFKSINLNITEHLR